MNISQVFSTPERISILRHVVYSIEPVSVGKVAVETGLSKGLVSKYLDLLQGEGVLERSGSRYGVVEGVETRAVRIVLNLDDVVSFPFGDYSFIRGVGLYGSSAHGSNTVRSDIDLWVLVGEASEEDLASLTGELRLRLGDVRPLFFTEDKLALLRREASSFYASLLHGSILIFGEGLEAV